MKSSDRLKAKKAQKQIVGDQKLKKKVNDDASTQKAKRKRASTKEPAKPVLSLGVTTTQKGKEVSVHDKFEISVADPLYTRIDRLVELLGQKQKRKDANILKVVEYSIFPSFEFQLRKTQPGEQKCCICQYEFEEPKDYEQELLNDHQEDILHLKCTHLLHKNCLTQMLGDKHWIKCPLCYTIFGELTGDQPPGSMSHNVDKNLTCDGYPKGTIVIRYSMKSGTRDGVSFSGTHRTGYLPNIPEGQEVLQLLKVAFDRKLVFTVGQSVTTGLDNQVVWNGIHHKTQTSGGSSHFGYPDPTYFSRVKIQMAMKGVC